MRYPWRGIVVGLLLLMSYFELPLWCLTKDRAAYKNPFSFADATCEAPDGGQICERRRRRLSNRCAASPCGGETAVVRTIRDDAADMAAALHARTHARAVARPTSGGVATSSGPSLTTASAATLCRPVWHGLPAGGLHRPRRDRVLPVPAQPRPARD
eukprot:7391601-Prymnesium_polylepis.1